MTLLGGLHFRPRHLRKWVLERARKRVVMQNKERFDLKENGRTVAWGHSSDLQGKKSVSSAWNLSALLKLRIWMNLAKGGKELVLSLSAVWIFKHYVNVGVCVCVCFAMLFFLHCNYTHIKCQSDNHNGFTLLNSLHSLSIALQIGIDCAVEKHDN